MIGAITAGLFGNGVAASLNSYESISTVTVGAGGASVITFSSIPSTYKHLELRYTAKSSSTLGGYPTGSYISFNSDVTDANYTGHRLIGDGSSASASSSVAARNGGLISIAGSSGSWSSSSLFTTGVVSILDYGSTSKNKVSRALNGGDANGAGTVGLYSLVWLNSANAINSIMITADATYQTSFIQNSSFALYGIKG